MAGSRWLPGIFAGILLVIATAIGPIQGDEIPVAESRLHTGPTIRVHYQELLNRQMFPFVTGENGPYKKPAGQLSFTFPSEEFPSEGLDPAFRTYCAEPLVPIYAGRDYTFTVEPFGKPSDFDLPDTEEGRATAARRAAFVRELYGKHYVEAGTASEIGAPAFQIALWELLREREFPEGPNPFNLSTGTFRAALAAGQDAPAHVQRAQEYLDDLTGDDTAFLDNEHFTGMELVRLEDVESINGMPIQAQILPRTMPVSTTETGGLGGMAGLGSLGGLGGGGLGSGLGMAGAPMLGGGGMGGGGSGAGGGRPGLVAPIGGGIGNNPGNGSGGGNPGNQIGVDPPTNPPPIDIPPTEKPPVDPPPVDPPPVDPPPVDPPPVDPVPAPPAAVLGLVAGAMFLGRRIYSRKTAESTP